MSVFWSCIDIVMIYRRVVERQMYFSFSLYRKHDSAFSPPSKVSCDAGLRWDVQVHHALESTC